MNRLLRYATSASLPTPKPRAPGEISKEMEEALKEVEKARSNDQKIQEAKGSKKK